MAEEGRPLEVSVGSVMEVEVGLENSLLEPVEDCRVLVRLEQDNTGIPGYIFGKTTPVPSERVADTILTFAQN